MVSNPKISKNIILQSVFSSGNVESDDLGLEQIIKNAQLNLSKIADHQSGISRYFYCRIPKSAQILAWEIAKKFKKKQDSQERFTEKTLAIILYYLCTKENKDCKKMITEFMEDTDKIGEQLVKIKNDKLQTNKDLDSSIRGLLTVCQTILFSIDGDRFGGHFENVDEDNILDNKSKAENKPIKAEYFRHKYTASWYTKYDQAFIHNDKLLNLPTTDSFNGPFSNKWVITSGGAIAIKNKKEIQSATMYKEFLLKTIKNITGHVIYGSLDSLIPDIDENTKGNIQELIINFYNNYNKLGQKHPGITYLKENSFYKIQPNLGYNPNTKHYSLYWEIGKESSFVRKDNRDYMFHMQGNFSNAIDGFSQISDLFLGNMQKSDTIHVIGELPHKGINTFLNPNVTSNLTEYAALEGYLLGYNKLVEDKVPFELTICANSNGNFMASRLIDEIKRVDSERLINFIGFTTPTNLNDVAPFLVANQMGGNIIASMVNTVKNAAMEQIDVYASLEKIKGYKIIFNCTNDDVIPHEIQIQNHKEFANNTIVKEIQINNSTHNSQNQQIKLKYITNSKDAKNLQKQWYIIEARMFYKSSDILGSHAFCEASHFKQGKDKIPLSTVLEYFMKLTNEQSIGQTTPNTPISGHKYTPISIHKDDLMKSAKNYLIEVSTVDGKLENLLRIITFSKNDYISIDTTNEERSIYILSEPAGFWGLGGRYLNSFNSNRIITKSVIDLIKHATEGLKCHEVAEKIDSYIKKIKKIIEEEIKGFGNILKKIDVDIEIIETKYKNVSLYLNKLKKEIKW